MIRGVHPTKPIMHIAFSPNFHKIVPSISTKLIHFPLFLQNLCLFCLIYVFLLLPLFWPRWYALWSLHALDDDNGNDDDNDDDDDCGQAVLIYHFLPIIKTAYSDYEFFYFYRLLF